MEYFQKVPDSHLHHCLLKIGMAAAYAGIGDLDQAKTLQTGAYELHTTLSSEHEDIYNDNNVIVNFYKEQREYEQQQQEIKTST